uniref:FYVE-type domain-containing protein n=1 Tax=Phytophthora ramorum TaxID=164328 RepID=H3GZP2_PHYRM
MKGRFIVNPFQELKLSLNDRAQLEDLANQCITSNLELFTKFTSTAKRTVDPKRWKLIKEGEKLKVYSERPGVSTKASAAGDEPTGSGLPMLLCNGTMEGKLDDLMFGLISENLETMRLKASYVDDISGAAVLDDVFLPTEEKPFQSLVIKWMELDIPFHSTSLVKNRDYVYLEGTGYVRNEQGERMGYHVLHSVSFAQTHQLPNRVRGNMSIVGFWRQIGSNTMEMYATGVMDPVDNGLIRKLVIPSIADVFMSTLKYAYCGQMRKLSFMLDKKYAESKMRGTPNRKRICMTCSSPISSRGLGDFGKSNSTCKLCFGFVCHACKITRKLSFVDPDLLLSQRKVTFCTACISEVTSMGAIDVARAQIATRKQELMQRASFVRTLSSDDSSVDASYSSK